MGTKIRRFSLKTAALLLPAILMVSCTAENNRRKLNMLDLGMGKSQVIKIMGDPYINETYKQPDGGSLVALFYLTDDSVWPPLYTPIVFENGKVIGWGRNFYEDRVKMKVDVKQDINIKRD